MNFAPVNHLLYTRLKAKVYNEAKEELKKELREELRSEFQELLELRKEVERLRELIENQVVMIMVEEQ